MNEIATIGTAVVSSLIYSLLFFVKKNSGEEIESYDLKKLGATLVVGLGVGVSMVIGNVDLTQVAFEQRLAGLAGVVAVVESVLKILYRQAQKRL